MQFLYSGYMRKYIHRRKIQSKCQFCGIVFEGTLGQDYCSDECISQARG